MKPSNAVRAKALRLWLKDNPGSRQDAMRLAGFEDCSRLLKALKWHGLVLHEKNHLGQGIWSFREVTNARTNELNNQQAVKLQRMKYSQP